MEQKREPNHTSFLLILNKRFSVLKFSVLFLYFMLQASSVKPLGIDVNQYKKVVMKTTTTTTTTIRATQQDRRQKFYKKRETNSFLIRRRQKKIPARQKFSFTMNFLRF